MCFKLYEKTQVPIESEFLQIYHFSWAKQKWESLKKDSSGKKNLDAT